MWGYGYYGHPMMGGYEGFGIMGILFSIFWVIVFIAAIVALVRFARGKSMWRCRHGHGEAALDILKERYAKGEIGKAEFEEKKKDLG
ncbi:MAG TPA: SHOCT domain-containing protein [Candidatus Paceibacterota bacterium]|nr:SHOCT domain-containing protein [Candidatus Paceibacterota bacterium]